MNIDDSDIDRPTQPSTRKLSNFLLIERINQCPQLASLKSINKTLNELLASDQSFVGQIAEVIRLDPSLTTRVLDLVNSIFFGSSDKQKISGVEEASIFLGLNRIKELLAATPIIEDIVDLGKNVELFPWENFWKHSIGTAIFTREILSIAKVDYEDETDYVAGLLHNLGKLILAITFPDLFQKTCKISFNDHKESEKIEKEIIGWSHAKIGAYYLWNHHISDEIVEAVHCHNSPQEARESHKLASAIQIADHLTHQLGVHGLEKINTPQDSHKTIEGWKLLFGNLDEEIELIELDEKIENTKERISKVLHGVL